MADFSEPEAKMSRMDFTFKGMNILDLPCEILLKIFWMLPAFDIHQGVAIVAETIIKTNFSTYFTIF